ncbi:hypothetical protein BRARA_F02175 [Brassica rapa]|uniref:Tic22-like family protein n=2 Tax=Brassica campestris TaxID=3711 RepID=A0A397Z003_BRACM|nr:uncharacterized protein LOC106347843 [Brassica napus]KAG5393883.1 hypothetical protein IGI04_023846 [Brassica rapa subsp. trilocularis]RID58915.1 hypothetical protein BRARA_F02175 [Brassica rapa]
MDSPDKIHRRYNAAEILHGAAISISSIIPLFPPKTTPSRVCLPLRFSDVSSTVKNASSTSTSSSGLNSTVRISSLSSDGKRGGPAFVGQVFSMCDLTGTGLMAVSTHFDIPFISKRTPEWLKKMFSTITKSERKGPVFRFFMDLGDAVSYVKKLNIPSGVVGACRLDLAYEHFKEKPHLFQFVPNERQVKAANKLLKSMPPNEKKQRVDGVPVFAAQNLDIAVATSDGIKWYTPYFFDKAVLDNILEESVDQHFHTLIQTRHVQRRRDVVDDSLTSEIMEEMGDSMLEPPEVQEAMEEIGTSGIPLSVVAKAAEIQLLYAVDRVLLGSRWFRKATGIQPKLPYLVDSFERRSALSIQRASGSTTKCLGDSDSSASLLKVEDGSPSEEEKRQQSLWFPFGDWLNAQKGSSGQREMESREREMQRSPFLPKITMVGISTGEAAHMSKANLKKTMEDLTQDLEQSDEGSVHGSNRYDPLKMEERDPLFVANVGDYYSGLARAGSARWSRRGDDRNETPPRSS